MGCWNETCFLTRLPILEGEPVKLLFLAENTGYARNNVHASGFWQPVCLPFHGCYDGYGRIESLTPDPSNDMAFKMLSAAKLGILDHDACGDGISDNDLAPFDTSGLTGNDREQVLLDITEKAAHGKLQIRVRVPSHSTHHWVQITPILAHAWAWEHIINAVDDPGIEWIGSITFRLTVNGPLREALCRLDPVWGDRCRHSGETPDIDQKDAGEIARILSAMEALRIALAPTCGSGSQSILSENWQLDFYKNVFLRAAAMQRLYDDEIQAPFNADIAWDGNFATADRNNNFNIVPGVQADLDPSELYMALLDMALTNVLDAMNEAAEYHDDTGEDQNDYDDGEEHEDSEPINNNDCDDPNAPD